MRGASVAGVETTAGADPENISVDSGNFVAIEPPAPEGDAYPAEAPLDPSHNPPVVDDGSNPEDVVATSEANPNLTAAAYLPIIGGETDGNTSTDNSTHNSTVSAAAINASVAVKYYFPSTPLRTCFGGQRGAPFDSAQGRHEPQRFLPLSALGPYFDSVGALHP